MNGRVPLSKPWLQEQWDVIRDSVGVSSACEPFWISGEFSKVKVVVDIDPIPFCMAVELVVPVTNAMVIMDFGS